MDSERNNSPHWTESDFVARLYGLEPEAGRSEDHLKSCAGCATRWSELESGRRRMLDAAPVTDEALDERLRAQRQAVWARIEKPRRGLMWRLVPVTTTALMIFAGLALQHQTKAPVAPRPVISQASDAQFFNEVASMVNQEMPRAADPMQGLFDSTAEHGSIEAQ